MKVYFSLGANLGDREATINKAIDMMEEQIGTCLCRSALLETEPWGFDSDNAFLNAAACFDTKLTAELVLETAKGIERTLGRTHKSVNGDYKDRTIDIDILLYGHETIDEETLKVPHPLMFQRDFVMRPLGEIIAKEDMEWLNSVKN